MEKSPSKAAPCPQTLKQLLRTAANPLWKGLVYEKTAYRSCEQFIEIVGDLPLEHVTTLTLDYWKRSIAVTKVSPSTINRKLVNIHSLLRYAQERDWLTKMPKMSWEREGEGRIRWVSKEEEQIILATLASWGEHAVASFVTVLIETGMRRGELLGMQSDQLDGSWARLWKTKTKTPRSVPLTPKAQEILRHSLPWKIDEGHIRRVWEKVRASMGLKDDKDFVLHTLRHTTATRLLKKSKNIAMVQKMLGHKKIATTLRYAHIDDQDLLNAVVN